MLFTNESRSTGHMNDVVYLRHVERYSDAYVTVNDKFGGGSVISLSWICQGVEI